MITSAAQPSDSTVSLAALLQGIAGPDALARCGAERRIANLSLDSRRLSPDDLFIAVPGERDDGRNHVAAATRADAAIIFEKQQAPLPCLELERNGMAIGINGLRARVSDIAGRFFDQPSAKLAITGITGTNGKTTCAWLLTQALEYLGEVCMFMGTIGIGNLKALEPAALTTGDAIAVQRCLRQLLGQGATAVCMEVSSHGLQQDRIRGVNVAVAVFTNLSQDHLDYHHSMEAYAEAKKKLFAFDSLKAVVVNADDPLGREIIAQSQHPVLISYGIDDADVMASELRCDASGINFILRWQGFSAAIHSPLLGVVNLPNLLAVAAALLAHGFQFDEVAGVLPQLGAPPGRMELVTASRGGPVVVIDYAHTPDSLQRALQSLRVLCDQRLTVVFGCGGDRDQAKRSQMGNIAAGIADRIIVTNDNPRSEDPAIIAAAIVEGAASSATSARVEIILDRRLAIQQAITSAAAGDLVLVAGKGHETTQTMGSSITPFNDRQVVAEILAEIQEHPR